MKRFSTETEQMSFVTFTIKIGICIHRSSVFKLINCRYQKATLAVWTSFSGRYRCGEEPVVERLKSERMYLLCAGIRKSCR